MRRKSGFAHILIFGLLLVLAVATGLYFLVYRKILPPSTISKAKPTVTLQTQYQNPFDKNSQYTNPFSQYKNPFEVAK